LLAMLNEARAYYTAHPEQATRFAGDPDVAAWTATVRILLNTDEFITRS